MKMITKNVRTTVPYASIPSTRTGLRFAKEIKAQEGTKMFELALAKG